MYKYRTIYNDLKQRILSRELRPGVPLPTQEELADEYQVNRLTLKKALDMLVHDGIIYSVQGSGTYIRPQLGTDLDELLPLDAPNGATDLHRNQRTSSRVIHFETRHPTEDECEHLEIKDDQLVYDIMRTRLVNNQPYSFDHTVMPTFVGHIDESTLQHSIYDYLEGRGLQLTDARRIVYADSADDDVSAAMEIQLGSPVLVIEQIGYDQYGRAFEYARSWFRQKHSRFAVDIHKIGPR